jgi:hypothetical protein
MPLSSRSPNFVQSHRLFAPLRFDLLPQHPIAAILRAKSLGSSPATSNRIDCPPHTRFDLAFATNNRIASSLQAVLILHWSLPPHCSFTPSRPGPNLPLHPSDHSHFPVHRSEFQKRSTPLRFGTAIVSSFQAASILHSPQQNRIASSLRAAMTLHLPHQIAAPLHISAPRSSGRNIPSHRYFSSGHIDRLVATSKRIDPSHQGSVCETCRGAGLGL